MGTAGAPTDNKYNIVVVDDEDDIRNPLQNFLKHRDFKTESCKSGAALAAILSTGLRRDIIISDLNLRDGETHLDAIIVFLREQGRRAGFILMSGDAPNGSTQRPLGLPSDVAYEFLQKPFGLEVAGLAVSRMVAHIRDAAAAVLEEYQVLDEPDFTTPLDSFSDLAKLMNALPTDAQKVKSQEGQLEAVAALINDALTHLSATLRENAETFQTEWLRYFPANKRESLLALVQDNPATEFVLDCCWHDINGVLTKIQLSGAEWTLKDKKKIHAHLAPARCAFSRYNKTHNPKAFLHIQKITIKLLRAQYPHVHVEKGVDRHVEGPAGAVMSIFETFPSNGAKVAQGRPYMLDIDFEDKGDHTEALIFDDLPPFSEAQRARLFDGRLESTSGWGTGLHRLSHLLALMWGEDPSGVLPIDSYHFVDGKWLRKSPGKKVEVVAPCAINKICPQRPGGATKFFILRFRHTQKTMASNQV